jgi:hypothetical protein
MRCVENSPSHRLALAHGWTRWARTTFDGPAATQPAIGWPPRSTTAPDPGTALPNTSCPWAASRRGLRDAE